MRTFRLNKLVRDKIVPSMEELGQVPSVRKLDDDAEFEAALAAKLIEEAKEFRPGKEGSENELADMREVIDTLASLRGMTPDELRVLQVKRREERGGFTGRLLVETLEVPDGDKWADYYAAEPDRFPEV